MKIKIKSALVLHMARKNLKQKFIKIKAVDHMKISKIILFALLSPVTGFAQTLGSTAGNNVEIGVIAGSTGSNNLRNKTWLYRNQNGTDWYTARLHDGINIDASFLTPHVDTRTWWERDPYGDLQSWGNSSSTYLTLKQGDLGIGTVAPRAALDVARFIPNGALGSVFGRLGEGDNIGNGTYLGVQGFETQIGTYGGKSFSIIHSFYSEINSSINFYRGGGSIGGYLTFSTHTNLERMRITSSGDVAIGTTDSKGYKLAVAGSMIAESVKVKLQGAWPDFVFAKNYQLPSLQETEQHILAKGHLPGIPSAAEVAKEGIELGEMNKKLLQKIEELTLYLIEMKKEIDALKANDMQNKKTGIENLNLK